MMRTAKGRHRSARSQQLQSAKVNLFVTPQRIGN
jgi:hypothetical protein